MLRQDFLLVIVTLPSVEETAWRIMDREGEPQRTGQPSAEQSPRKALEQFEGVFAYRLTIMPPLDESSDQPSYTEQQREEEERMWRTLQGMRGQLRREIEERIDSKTISLPDGSSAVLEYNVASVSYWRGTIEILVVLGVLYTALRDYEAVRKSVRDAAKDLGTLRNYLSTLLPAGPVEAIRDILGVPADWTVKGELVAESTGPAASPAAGGEPPPPIQDSKTPSVVSRIRPSWEDAGRLAVLYVVVSNVLLILFLGFLLVFSVIL